MKKKLDKSLEKLKNKTPSPKNKPGLDSKKNELANMSLLDELRNEAVNSLHSGGNGGKLNDEDEFMNEVFGDENSAINDDGDFIEDEPDHGFAEEESGAKNRSSKNSKKSKTMAVRDQYSEGHSQDSRGGRSPNKSKTKGQSMITNKST